MSNKTFEVKGEVHAYFKTPASEIQTEPDFLEVYKKLAVYNGADENLLDGVTFENGLFYYDETAESELIRVGMIEKD